MEPTVPVHDPSRSARPDAGGGETSAPKVLAAMSGGVDSSVATLLLHQRGFEVVGSMMRFWPDDREAGAFDACCSPQAAYDARRVADALDVPFYLLDERERFDEIVVDPFVPSYVRGETPNPCVWCNREIKFGDFVRRARALGASFMATGHFVRRVDGPSGVELHRGRDDDKDQTYFLWALPREVLPMLLFPLGDLTKAEVRRIASEHGFATAYKKSSSGLCFVADTVRDHLARHTDARPGAVVDASRGREVVGEHQGVQFYTVGQKRGLGLFKSHEPRFVVDLEVDTNTVVVGPREMCEWSSLTADRVNFLCHEDELPARVQAQVRYRQTPAPARLERTGDGVRVHFDAPRFAVTVGQSVVLYDGERLLGGGVIRARGPE
ncbi:MAG: tRNA 2-thiouridine(34) synthase MnmA [Trueperaceae bacterium]|nr:tRNA 2-thiouridine(34) synthase MnmA [Trueperaceae bacterium]